MTDVPKTRMQVLQTICEFLRRKGAAPIDLKEVVIMGIDYDTAKSYVTLMERSQRRIARLYIHESDEEEKRPIMIESEYGLKHDKLNEIAHKLLELIGDDTPEWEEREPSLNEELKDVLRARSDRPRISIELPKKEFHAILHCDICGFQIDFPYHCKAGPLQFNTEKRELYCDICGFQSSIPKHCGVYMSGEYYVGNESLAFVRVKDEN